MWSECVLICYKSNYGDMRFDSLLITHTCMTTQTSTIWSSITCCLHEKMMICKYFIKTYNAYRASNKEKSTLILFTSYAISEMFYGYSWTIIYANKWCLQKIYLVNAISYWLFSLKCIWRLISLIFFSISFWSVL